MTELSEQYNRVRREKLKQWHVVESTIAGAAITKCGRRMEAWSVERGSLVWANSAEASLAPHEMCGMCGP